MIIPFKSAERFDDDVLKGRWQFIESNWFLILLRLLISTLLVIACMSFGMKRIGGFDHSAMIETAWRVWQGHVPIKDFCCTFPVGFYAGTQLAFKWFGVEWSSFVILNAIFSVAAFNVLANLINRTLKHPLFSMLVAVSLLAMTTVYVGYWWYHSTTVVSALMFAFSVLWWLKEVRLGSAITVVLSAFLLSLMKANQAGLLLLTSFVVLVALHQRRLLIIGMYAAAFTLHCLFLPLFGITIIDELEMLTSISGRGMPNLHALIIPVFTTYDRLIIFLQLGWLFAPLPLLFWRDGDQKKSILRGMGILVLLTGTYGLFSNFEAKQLEMPLIFTGMALLFFGEKKGRISAVMKGWAVLTLSMFMCYGFLFGAKRERVRFIGNYASEGMHRISETRFFNGVEEGTEFRNLRSGLAGLVHKYEGHRIFFGPRIEFAYAEFNLPSNVNFPTWWHPGTSFPRNVEGKIIHDFLESEIEILVFYNNDYSFYGERINNAIREHFEIIEDTEFTVWKRKSP